MAQPEDMGIEYKSTLSDGPFFEVGSVLVKVGRSSRTAVCKKVNNSVSAEVYGGYLEGQMSVLRRVKHINIISLLNVNEAPDSVLPAMPVPSLLLEPALQGDLRAILTGQESAHYQEARETKLRRARDVATGAAVLSALRPKVLHCCLAAHHVLIDATGRCKLTGFSTAKAVRAREAWEAIHKVERPVRWMSRETLEHLVHTTQSDVWSYGVFLWELFSAGKTPYAGIIDAAILRTIQEGYRLEMPDSCDADTYELMMECWIHNAQRRPSFDDIAKRLSTSLNGSICDVNARPTSGEHIYFEVL